LEQGGQLEMRTDDAGTAGYCLFPDGTECEEWAFFRGECGPGTPQP
jgi:putative hemolysin